MAAGLYDITNEVLGKGHFAVVKLAKHCLTGELVAIKIIDKSKLAKEGLEQLSCEIKLWSRLSENEHPNVVKLYQCIDTRTKLYLVMEYCGDHVLNLYDYLQKKNDGEGLDENEAKVIFRQVCQALHYCHSLNIVHRDVKPENILIVSGKNGRSGNGNCTSPVRLLPNPQVQVKLIDFGFSNLFAENELLQTSCGSLAYSAPEILLGSQYDGPKVDVWALGCILYILVYGVNPFMQITDTETLTRILDCSFTTPIKDNVNDLCIDLIRALLRKNPQARLNLEQILNHGWLHDDNFPIILPQPTSSKMSPFHFHQNHHRSNHLHANRHPALQPVDDQIIDQMIQQGISLSKADIMNILNGSPNNEPEEVFDGPSGDDKPINNYHYVKATYLLLKDKNTREVSGITRGNGNVNYTRRGNILKKSNNLNRNLNLQPLNAQALSHVAAERRKRNNILLAPQQSLEVPVSPSTTLNSAFALPLARKCSIVSEEGSVENASQCSSSLGGERTSSCDLHQSPNPPASVNTRRSVDIFDSPIGGGLHPVSSSPDFLLANPHESHSSIIEQEEEEDLDQQQSAFCDNIYYLEDPCQNESSATAAAVEQSHLHNVRVSKAADHNYPHQSVSNHHLPSVRIIKESKSLNNITLVEMQQQKEQQAMVNSMSAANVVTNSRLASDRHQPSKPKADCCTIC